MPITYINRKEDTYYFHEGKTKTGKPKYYFSKKDKGNLVDSIPDGYEIYENPNAQVFLRRKMQTLIFNEEFITPPALSVRLEKAMLSYAFLEHSSANYLT